jgi:hypothetical protein
MGKINKIKLTVIVIGALVGWFAVLAQFYLIIHHRTSSIPETIVRFFSYFTILTNSLVAVCYTGLIVAKYKKRFQFFSNPKTITAIAVYISIVGLVYNIILRYLWQPEGLQRLVDEALHSIAPVWFVLFWFFFVPKNKLKYKDFFPWLLYPLCYIIFILIRGAFSNFYPYPFIDVNNLGYVRVFLNSVGLTCAFAFVSLLFIFFGRRNNLAEAHPE